MQATKDIFKLMAGIPVGAWVAIARDEEHVIAYAATLPEAIKLAKEKGEPKPIVIRVPQAGAAAFL